MEVSAGEAPDNGFDLGEGIPSIYRGRRSVTRFDVGSFLLQLDLDELSPAKDWLGDFSTSDNFRFNDRDPDWSTERRNRVENQGGDEERG